MKLHALLSILVLLMASAQALAVELVVWQPVVGATSIILPVPGGQSPQQAASAYLKAMQTNPLVANVGSSMIPNLPAGVFLFLSSNDLARRALLIGNSGSDLRPSDRRVLDFRMPLEREGQSVYLLPPVADLHVPAAEQNELRRKLVLAFPLMIAMGGADVDPLLYGEQVTYARDFNRRRDLFEAKLLRDFVAAGRGFLFGVCRGHQISGVAMGLKLIQDIPKQVGQTVAHGRANHEITLRKTTNGLFASIVGVDRLTVNSYHHQAVIVPAGQNVLELAAVSADGVTEAMEMRNGRGLFVQFHPELMAGDPIAARIWRGIVLAKNRVVALPLR